MTGWKARDNYVVIDFSDDKNVENWERRYLAGSGLGGVATGMTAD